MNEYLRKASEIIARKLQKEVIEMWLKGLAKAAALEMKRDNIQN